jgi:hypothetical protein
MATKSGDYVMLYVMLMSGLRNLALSIFVPVHVLL